MRLSQCQMVWLCVCSNRLVVHRGNDNEQPLLQSIGSSATAVSCRKKQTACNIAILLILSFFSFSHDGFLSDIHLIETHQPLSALFLNIEVPYIFSPNTFSRKLSVIRICISEHKVTQRIWHSGESRLCSGWERSQGVTWFFNLLLLIQTE